MLAVREGAVEEEPSCDEVLEHLFIANQAFAHSRQLIKDHKIKAILCLTQTQNPNQEILQRRRVHLLQLCVQDVKTENIYDHFQPCCDFIYSHVQQNHNVLVHCHQGTSRSVAVLIAFIMHKQRWTLRTAFQFVLDQRKSTSPPSHPNSGFLMQLVRWEKKLGLCPETGPSLEFLEYAREAHRQWSGRNRGPCAKERDD